MIKGKMMSEPTLESIGDYDTLKGEKKKIVWAVIIIGLLIGGVYVYVNNTTQVDDSIKIEDSIKNVPSSKNIMLK